MGRLLSDSLQLQGDLPLFWMCSTVGFWLEDAGIVGPRADQQGLRSLASAGSLAPGTPGDFYKKKGVLVTLSHASMYTVSASCIAGDNGTTETGGAHGKAMRYV